VSRSGRPQERRGHIDGRNSRCPGAGGSEVTCVAPVTGLVRCRRLTRSGRAGRGSRHCRGRFIRPLTSPGQEDARAGPPPGGSAECRRVIQVASVTRSFCTGLMRAETVSRIEEPEGIFTGGIRDDPERRMALHRKVPVEDSAYETAVAGLSRHFACGCGYRHGRSGSCRATATASARARCAWQRVIDCCTVMRSCATDHRSRASGRVISIPGSRSSSSSDSEIERV
jgi:hypothetical protein